MLDTTGMSWKLWGVAVLIDCHTLNRVLIKNKEKIPFEEWENKRLTLSYLRMWGCLAKVNIPIAKKHKLGPKTVDCIFLGYAIHSVGYRFLIIKSGVTDMNVGNILESRDATFFETEFSMKNTPSTSSHESILFPETHEPVTHADFETHVESPEEDDNEAPRRSKRQKTVKSFGDDFIVYLVDDTKNY